MIRYVLLALLVAAIGWLLLGPRIRGANWRDLGRWALVGGGLALLLFLALTGRLNWLFALFAALIPLAQRLLRLLPAMGLARRAWASVRQRRAAAGTPGGQSSTVRTRYLHMTLDHDSGALAGEVVAGVYAGRRLDGMQLPELLDLLERCRDDHQSVMVLETYLDRLHGDAWRDARSSGQAPGAAADGPMSRDEALRILGLGPGADRDAVIDAHRRLMQKLHPDRGGSDWLAAQINRAKGLLLDEGDKGGG
ncbi:MAG: molecular chaperone DnaJ [Gammaproteobacteria bacterium]|nr:molecular chaperone DnaJ [Gammaproteobacteria bacterium]